VLSNFTFSQFLKRFPNDDVCLEEIKKLRYPDGVHCTVCNRTTIHYRVKGRTAYTCKFCRNQIFPLAGTVFTKTSTSLRLWFYALYLLTQTRANISAKELQQELQVTYKTAWRIKKLITENNADLLFGERDENKNRIHKWVFFNKFQITLVEKHETGK